MTKSLLYTRLIRKSDLNATFSILKEGENLIDYFFYDFKFPGISKCTIRATFEIFDDDLCGFFGVTIYDCSSKVSWEREEKILSKASKDLSELLADKFISPIMDNQVYLLSNGRKLVSHPIDKEVVNNFELLATSKATIVNNQSDTRSILYSDDLKGLIFKSDSATRYYQELLTTTDCPNFLYSFTNPLISITLRDSFDYTYFADGEEIYVFFPYDFSSKKTFNIFPNSSFNRTTLDRAMPFIPTIDILSRCFSLTEIEKRSLEKLSTIQSESISGKINVAEKTTIEEFLKFYQTALSNDFSVVCHGVQLHSPLLLEDSNSSIEVGSLVEFIDEHSSFSFGEVLGFENDYVAINNYSNFFATSYVNSSSVSLSQITFSPVKETRYFTVKTRYLPLTCVRLVEESEEYYRFEVMHPLYNRASIEESYATLVKCSPHTQSTHFSSMMLNGPIVITLKKDFPNLQEFTQKQSDFLHTLLNVEKPKYYDLIYNFYFKLDLAQFVSVSFMAILFECKLLSTNWETAMNELFTNSTHKRKKSFDEFFDACLLDIKKLALLS